MPVTIWTSPDVRGVGWSPIGHMLRLMAEMFDAEIAESDSTGGGIVNRLSFTLRRERRGGDRIGIYVAPTTGHIPALLAAPGFAQPHQRRLLWVIDSFWTERLPSRHLLRSFDVIAYTRAGDAPEYEAAFGNRALFLGWGSDVLGLGSANAERPIDIMRIGRQPPAWDDDVRTAAACRDLGLRFQGRTPSEEDPTDHQRALMQRLAQARFVVAHSNVLAPARYTHPRKGYITARWTDSLASGATVAGGQPQDDLGLIDWPGATVELPVHDLQAGLELLKPLAESWTPERAATNHRLALQRLDWRWRFEALAAALEIRPPRLERDLKRLHAAIGTAGQPGAR